MSLNDVLSIINEQGYVQDIGQLTSIRKDLDKLVRRGEIQKARMPWLGYMGGLKTTYYK